MIDLMKRLTELDATNPNVIKNKHIIENTDETLDECGMMPMQSVTDHHSPATINISADSGQELSDMLRDIMTLAGHDHADEPVSTPVAALEPVGPPETDPTSTMRSVIDKLHLPGSDEQDDEKKDIDEYDNAPEDPTDQSEFDSDQFAHQENQPGQGDRMDGSMPKGIPTMEEVEKNLLDEYRKFVESELQ